MTPEEAFEPFAKLEAALAEMLKEVGVTLIEGMFHPQRDPQTGRVFIQAAMEWVNPDAVVKPAPKAAPVDGDVDLSDEEEAIFAGLEEMVSEQERAERQADQEAAEQLARQEEDREASARIKRFQELQDRLRNGGPLLD